MYLKYFTICSLSLLILPSPCFSIENTMKRNKRSVIWNLPDQSFKTMAMNSQSLCLAQSGSNQLACYNLYSNQLKLPPEQHNIIGNYKVTVLGERHLCAISSQDSSTYCWGSNEKGQLATGDTENVFFPKKVFTSENFTTLALSLNNTYALDETGKIWGWGSNQYGQLGYFNYDLPSYFPYQVSNEDDNYFTISTGNDFFCALSNEGSDNLGKFGKIYCLGKGYSQVESEETLLEAANELIKLNENYYYSISSSWNHTCAINKQRKMECWGENKFGQSGMEPNSHSYVLRPVLVSHPTDPEFNSSNFKSIVTTPNATCATTDTNKTYCFGDNTFGQLGFKLGNEAIKEENSFRYSIQYLPKLLTKNSDVINKNYIKLAGNSRTLCGLTETEEVECWGFSEKNYFKTIHVGEDYYCGLSLKGNRAYCGSAKKSTDNYLNHPWNTTIEFPWVSKEEFVQLSAGEFAVCGLSSETSQNTFCAFNRKTPLFQNKFKFNKVNLPNQMQSVVVGHSHICTIQKQDGQIYCSGNNSYGQLGNGGFRSSKYAAEFKPIVNPAKIAFKEVALTERATCALSLANEVYCFGSNEYGELGSVSTVSTSKSALQKIKNLKLMSITAGSKHFCGVLADETKTKNKLVCWGDNSYGQIGKQNIKDPYQSNNVFIPYEVPHTEAVIKVSANDHTTCFLNNSNETYCFGKELENVIEQRLAATPNYIPFQVQKNSKFSEISLGKKMACGILQADKTIKCWGAKN